MAAFSAVPLLITMRARYDLHIIAVLILVSKLVGLVSNIHPQPPTRTNISIQPRAATTWGPRADIFRFSRPYVSCQRREYLVNCLPSLSLIRYSNRLNNLDSKDTNPGSSTPRLGTAKIASLSAMSCRSCMRGCAGAKGRGSSNSPDAVLRKTPVSDSY